MSDDENPGSLTFEAEREGRRLRVAVAAGGEVIHRDKVDPFSAASRRLFIRNLSKRLPGAADEDLIEDELLKLAGDIAADGDDVKLGGSRIEFEETEPAGQAVDGAALLGDIEGLLQRHLVIGDHEARAAALWALWTWVFDASYTAPILTLVSPRHRCGKSTCIAIIAGAASRVLPASNITPAAIFRTVEKYRPTLLLDEVDSFLVGKDASEEMRGIVNSGHTRPTAFVIRTEKAGEDYEPVRFSTWCPKLLALIQKGRGLPTTIEDRSIVIKMRRRAPGEEVKKLPRTIQQDMFPIRQRAARWAQDNFERCAELEPRMPGLASDRAADNWEPLVVVADLAGGRWPALARAAAVALAPDEGDVGDAAVELLEDIRAYFEKYQIDRVRSSELVEHLTGLQERPWADWRRGRGLNPRGLAKLLAPFEVGSRNLRFDGDRVGRGYQVGDFEDAFRRYTPTPLTTPPSKRYSATGPGDNENLDFSSATADPGVADDNPENDSKNNGCSTVAHPEGGSVGDTPPRGGAGEDEWQILKL